MGAFLVAACELSRKFLFRAKNGVRSTLFCVIPCSCSLYLEAYAKQQWLGNVDMQLDFFFRVVQIYCY